MLGMKVEGSLELVGFRYIEAQSMHLTINRTSATAGVRISFSFLQESAYFGFPGRREAEAARYHGHQV